MATDYSGIMTSAGQEGDDPDMLHHPPLSAMTIHRAV